MPREIRWLPALVVGALVASACGSTTGVFRDAPPVWKVDDAHTIAEPDIDNAPTSSQYAMDGVILRRLPRAMELPRHDPAANTNALDEVPDSTWFTNRIGRFDLTPEDVVRGPGGEPPTPPITISKGKDQGKNPGFFVKDARGRRYLIKFDAVENPEAQSAADVIGSRMFWAMGYFVPRDHIYIMRSEEILIDPKATYETPAKEKRPFTQKLLEDLLRKSPRLPDGGMRVLASELLDGVPKGSYVPEGVRSDDPNDTIPHELRRDLRGLRVFAAWLGHTDLSEGNSMDLFVHKGKVGYLRHYLLDFGEVFNGYGLIYHREEDGYEYWVDWSAQGKALLALGLWQRPWERLPHNQFKSIGYYHAEEFDPRSWKIAYPFFPFFEMDGADAFWATKIIMRFTRAHIEALVAKGKLSDPLAAKYLVDTIVSRQRTVGATFFDAVTALDDFHFEGPNLCATDLGVRYGVAPTASVDLLDGDVVVSHAAPDPTGHVCLRTPAHGGYHVLRLRGSRRWLTRPPVQVHVVERDGPRVVGIVREG